MIKTNYTYDNKEVSYEVVEKGYKIYLGGVLWITQEKPYIPYPELSYEENAIKQIEEICAAEEEAKNQPSMEQRIANLEAELAALKEQQINE